jgi:hypothetical protein
MIVIPKGKHHGNGRKFGIGGNVRSFKGYFTDSCRYDLGDIDQYDINKLYGMGAVNINLFKHTKTKPWYLFYKDTCIRIGWRYDIINDRIELFSYMYVDSHRKWKYLCSVKIGQIFGSEVKIFHGSMVARITDEDGVTVALHREKLLKPKRSWFFITLEAYFGGNRKAPNNIFIHQLYRKG